MNQAAIEDLKFQPFVRHISCVVSKKTHFVDIFFYFCLMLLQWKNCMNVFCLQWNWNACGTTYLNLDGIIPSPSSIPVVLMRLACHHSSSLALVTCRISPKQNAKPLLGNPESFDGSYSNNALQALKKFLHKKSQPARTVLLIHSKNVWFNQSIDRTIEQPMNEKHHINQPINRTIQ